MAKKVLDAQKARTRSPTYFKKWREFRGLTQDALAERIGMTKTRISMKERSEEPYDQYYLEALAEALNTDAPSLLARNPFDEDSLYKLLDQLSPATKAKAIEVVRALKIADERPAEPPAPIEAPAGKFRRVKRRA